MPSLSVLVVLAVPSPAECRRLGPPAELREPNDALSNLSDMRIPDIELLWWEGCPSTEAALAELRRALDEVGLSEAEIRTREIQSEDEAGELRFAGSPTVLIDGRDVADAAGQPIGLSCRVYRTRDGRISPTPDPDDLREALREVIR
jgi:hypothetical protein